MNGEERASRLLAQIVRAEPGVLATALGLGVNPATARLAGLLDGRRVTVSDESGASAPIDLTTGAMVPSLHGSGANGGLLVCAVPPGPVKLKIDQASWGLFGDWLGASQWPATVRGYVSRLASLSGALQEAVGQALALAEEPTTELADFNTDDGDLPGPSRFAVAALSLALRADFVGDDIELVAISGPSRHPVVRCSKALGGITVSNEVGLGANGEIQMVTLVWRDGAWGPTWRRRERDPVGYVNALMRTLNVVDPQLNPGGFLAQVRDEAEMCGWGLPAGKPDHLLLERTGVNCSLLLRPPSAAGLRFVAPMGADISFLQATFVALAKPLATAALLSAANESLSVMSVVS
jgi:hypothetical protein